jgi:hypothetical protein
VEDGDEPGMHRTDSTDFGVVLSGNVVLELDDGVELARVTGKDWDAEVAATRLGLTP